MSDELHAVLLQLLLLSPVIKSSEAGTVIRELMRHKANKGHVYNSYTTVIPRELVLRSIILELKCI
jgi:hypothetical protein